MHVVLDQISNEYFLNTDSSIVDHEQMTAETSSVTHLQALDY